MLKPRVRNRPPSGRSLTSVQLPESWIRIIPLCLSLLLVCPPVIFPADEALNEQLAAIIRKELPEGYAISIQIADATSGGVLMEANPHLPLIPASTMKIVTSAAALRTLGPDFKFITEARVDRVKGSVAGNLYIKGQGDPYMVTEELFKLAKALKNAGLAEIRGDIVVDDSFFIPERPVDEQEELSLKSYHAPYGALSLNFNTVSLSINPGLRPGQLARVELSPMSEYSGVKSSVVTVKGKKRPRVSLARGKGKDGREMIRVSGAIGEYAPGKTMYVNVKAPGLYTGAVLKEMLLREGISVFGKVRKGLAPRGAKKILDYESKPLAIIVYWLNKFSNNFIAEQLSMAMGAGVEGPPGTREKGLKVIEDFLVSCGAQKGEYRFKEASGLSRENRLSASALVRTLLRSENDFSYGPEFKASLGIAGVDGTLDDRFTEPRYARRLRAKTGSLRGVTALAGYGVSPDGREFVFACLVNSLKNGVGFIYHADRIMKGVLELRMGRPLW